MSKRRKTLQEPARLTLLDRMIIPLLTALVAFGASYLAATIGADTQQLSLDEQRRKEDRDKRTEAYMAYLDALGDYAPVFHSAVTCFRNSTATGLVAKTPATCREAMATDPKPLRQLKLAYNRVHVFGSIKVIQQVGSVHDAILVFEPAAQRTTAIAPGPPDNLEPRRRSPSSVEQAPPPTPDEAATKLDADYRTAFGDFVNAMCADLSTDPGTRCAR